MSETVTESSKGRVHAGRQGREDADDRLQLGGSAPHAHRLRGTWQLTWGARLIPLLKFTFLGKSNDPSSVAALTGDYSSWQAPTPGSTTDTPTFQLHGQSSLALSKLDLDHGVQTVHR